MTTFPLPLADKIAPARCALVIIDMQNDYAHEAGAYGSHGFSVQFAQQLVPFIRPAIDSARRAGVLVIYTRNWKQPWHISEPNLDRAARSPVQVGPNGVAGTWGADWYGVSPAPGEVVIDKTRYDAFLGTDLDQILRSQRIDSLVFCGIQSNVCVETSARSAFMRDYHVCVLADACATTGPEAHAAALRNIAEYFGEVVQVADVAAVWDSLPGANRVSRSGAAGF
jgi:ureidoacrylate peracid hydrolase